MSEYKLKKRKIGQVVVDAYKKVEHGFEETFLEEDESSESGYTLKTGKVGNVVVDAYKKVEDSVVGGYKKVEDGVVGSYKKVEHAFVDAFLEKVEQEKE